MLCMHVSYSPGTPRCPVCARCSIEPVSQSTGSVKTSTSHCSTAYLSRMSAMTHANISSPSGNCSATRFAPACRMRHTVLCTCAAPATCHLRVSKFNYCWSGPLSSHVQIPALCSELAPHHTPHVNNSGDRSIGNTRSNAMIKRLLLPSACNSKGSMHDMSCLENPQRKTQQQAMQYWSSCETLHRFESRTSKL